MLNLYSNPSSVGWLGWFEDAKGNCLAFVTLEGYIIPHQR